MWEKVAGERWTFDPTVSEVLFAARDADERINAEFGVGDDVEDSLGGWAERATEDWSWWSGQFVDLDAIFAYLQQSILAKSNNR